MKKTVAPSQKFALLQKNIAYQFKDIALLERACTPSAARAKREDLDNEYLEFLGDRILGFLVADALYKSQSGLSLGQMALRLNLLVRKDFLADVAAKIDLPRFLGQSVLSQSQCADACEALIAALYLDGGLAEAERFIMRFWGESLARVEGDLADPKTRLQEIAQKVQKTLPAYRLLKKSGKDHAPLFKVEVHVEGLGRAEGSSTSMRAAEGEAASALLLQISQSHADKKTP